MPPTARKPSASAGNAASFDPLGGEPGLAGVAVKVLGIPAGENTERSLTLDLALALAEGCANRWRQARVACGNTPP